MLQKINILSEKCLLIFHLQNNYLQFNFYAKNLCFYLILKILFFFQMTILSETFLYLFDSLKLIIFKFMFLCMEFLYLIFEKDFSLKITIFELRISIWIWTIKNDFSWLLFSRLDFSDLFWYLIQELFTNFLFKNSRIYFIFVISFQI